MQETSTSGAPETTVLHYVGYDDDRGGIVSVVRALASAGRFGCVLGVNQGFVQRRTPPLATIELPAIEGERINLRTSWCARAVALEVRRWLHAESGRVFHGHSRAGLIVALWLWWLGERAVVASVHSFGRQRWFYRWAARRLGSRLFWLGPAMKRHFGVGDTSWNGCVPDCVVLADWQQPKRTRTDGVVRFGCVGILAPVKQWDLGLRALAKVSSTVPLCVIHAGEEEATPEGAAYAEELRRLARGLGIAPRIEWRGEVKDMREFYAEIDCLLVASAREASSMAVLEAAASGIPVLAADVSGTRDLVEAADLGWLFRSGDPGDLARMMERLAESGSLSIARPKPEAGWRFAADRVAEDWARIYRNLQP
jgi:glycosyltransferase involved in cell wall biosynthesis